MLAGGTVSTIRRGLRRRELVRPSSRPRWVSVQPRRCRRFFDGRREQLFGPAGPNRTGGVPGLHSEDNSDVGYRLRAEKLVVVDSVRLTGCFRAPGVRRVGRRVRAREARLEYYSRTERNRQAVKSSPHAV